MTQPSTKEQAKKDIEALTQLPYPNAWNRHQKRANAKVASKLPRKTQQAIMDAVSRDSQRSKTAPTEQGNNK